MTAETTEFALSSPAGLPAKGAPASLSLELCTPGERLVELMVGYQGGNLSAFEQLYSLLAAPIRSSLADVTGCPRLADDLMIQTFLQIHAHRHTYRPPHSVERWVRDVAVYCLRTHGGGD